MKGNYNSFAQNQLKKFGWKEGDGIGKSTLGRAEPVKQQLKFDLAGLGFDHSKQFDATKWHDIYTEVSSRINVSDDGTAIATDASKSSSASKASKSGHFYSTFQKGTTLVNNLDSETEMKRKKKKKKTHQKDDLSDNDNDTTSPDNLISTKKNKKTKRSLDLLEDIIESCPVQKKKKKKKDKMKNDDESSLQTKNLESMTDTELFKFCEGRTCHQAARFGIKMTGKLARIERQNNALLADKKTHAKIT